MNVQTKIDSLKKKYKSIEVRANRACARYDDCGPMDIASETLDLIQKEIDLLEFRLANPGKVLPPKLAKINAELLKEKEQKDAERTVRDAFPKGSLVTFKKGTDENWGVPKELLKAKAFFILGRGRGGLKAALTPNPRTFWYIDPTDLVMVKTDGFKVVSPKEYIGKIITWNSIKKHCVMKGKVVNAGYTKVKTDSGWRVPLSLILTVDGKKI